MRKVCERKSRTNWGGGGRWGFNFSKKVASFLRKNFLTELNYIQMRRRSQRVRQLSGIEKFGAYIFISVLYMNRI